MSATTVEVSMLPQNAQPFYASGKGWDHVVSSKSTPIYRRRASIKEIVTGMSLLSCIVGLCLLYAKVLAMEKGTSCPVIDPQREIVSGPVADSVAAAASVVTDAMLTRNGNQAETTTQHYASITAQIPGVLGVLNPIGRRIRRNPGQHGGSGHSMGAGAGGHSGRDWNTAGSSNNGAEHPVHVHPFLHVTGIVYSSLSRGDWFLWNSEVDEDSGHLATTQIQFVHNKFAQITQSGYYFIYSQVTYRDTNEFAIGHEIVRKPNCGIGDNQRLLHSIKSQTEPETISSGEVIYPEDSGYVGGVFHLSASDRIGVRPLGGPGPQIRRFANNGPTGSYFGLFMLAADGFNQAVDSQACHGVVDQ